MDTNVKCSNLGGHINTLAQNGTGNAIILTGKGSDLNNSKALKGRAKKKLITQKMMLNLIDVVEKSSSPEDKKGYWNTFHCQSKIYSTDSKLFGKYCKNRFCTLCSSIRKADIINRYLPVIQTWSKPTFVTLTIKAVKASKLRFYVKHMLRAFRIINARYRKRSQRGKGIKLIGIKSLECNFNPTKRTYNPHFHFIVPDNTIAEILVNEWLALWTKKFALRICQNITPVFNNERALIETVKYGSKIFTEPADEKASLPPKIHAAALDNIFKAMKGFRIFDRFGFNLPKVSKVERSNSVFAQNFEEWSFQTLSYDWINNKSGEKLTDFDPSWHLIQLLQNHIDKDLK